MGQEIAGRSMAPRYYRFSLSLVVNNHLPSFVRSENYHINLCLFYLK